MQNFMTEVWGKAMDLFRNERGAQSLEWLGLAALLILLLGIISTAVNSGSGTISEIINNILTKIKNMVG